MNGRIAHSLGIWTAIVVSVATVIGLLWNIQSSLNSLHECLGAVNASLGEVNRHVREIRERGVIEVKPLADQTWQRASRRQNTSICIAWRNP